MGLRKSPPSGRKKGFAKRGGEDNLRKEEGVGKKGGQWRDGPLCEQKVLLELPFCKEVIGLQSPRSERGY